MKIAIAQRYSPGVGLGGLCVGELGGGGGMAAGRSIIAGRLDGNCWLIHRRLLLVWSFACLMGFSGPAPGEYFCATYM